VKLPRRAVAPIADTAAPPAESGSSREPELLAQRERLTERFALMQSELGGLFYEMAIRDHVQLGVLTEKAAALQRVDMELAQLEHILQEGGGAIGGHCPACGAAHPRGAAFCSQCAAALGGS
jgi:hypothetical protein